MCNEVEYIYTVEILWRIPVAFPYQAEMRLGSSVKHVGRYWFHPGKFYLFSFIWWQRYAQKGQEVKGFLSSRALGPDDVPHNTRRAELE